MDSSELNRLIKTTVHQVGEENRARDVADKLQNIFLTLYKIQVLSEATNQISGDNMKIVMTCFRELLLEVDGKISLSESFKETWL